MSTQSLLGNAPSSWIPKAAAGTLVGACFASALMASTASTSMYAAPVSQASSVATLPVAYVGAQSVRSNVAVAAGPLQSESDNFLSASSPQSSSWAPLAAAAAVPLAVFAAIAAFRTSKKAAVLDPIDLLEASGTRWSMVGSAGEYAIAKNYASALIELGQEGQCLEQIHSDVDAFGSFWADETFASFFNNPLMTAEKQKDVIAKICEESQMSPITKNFLSFLVDKRRIPQLPAIIKEFDEQFYDVTGTQVATVTAAVPLSEEQLRMIANKLHEMTKGKNIKIKSQVNSDLLAGFVLEYGKSGSQRIDLSLRGQLDDLKGELQLGIQKVLSGGIPAAVQMMIAAIGVNAVVAGEARADSGNIFDFGLTMPLQMLQFLILMVFLEKVVFTPVGKIIDERAAYIREKNAMLGDNTKEIDELNRQAEKLLEEARRDAAKELDQAKKEATKEGAEKLAKAKAEIDAKVKNGLAEVARSKEDLWAKLEQEVLPALVDDIINKLLEEEPAPAAAVQE